MIFKVLTSQQLSLKLHFHQGMTWASLKPRVLITSAESHDNQAIIPHYTISSFDYFFLMFKFHLFVVRSFILTIPLTSIYVVRTWGSFIDNRLRSHCLDSSEFSYLFTVIKHGPLLSFTIKRQIQYQF